MEEAENPSSCASAWIRVSDQNLVAACRKTSQIKVKSAFVEANMHANVLLS
jgi:hypothetical protein